jgi:hypothetical protein
MLVFSHPTLNERQIKQVPKRRMFKDDLHPTASGSVPDLFGRTKINPAWAD